MSKNNKIIAAVAVAVLMGASFYGGVAYGKGHARSFGGQFGSGQFTRSFGQGGMTGGQRTGGFGGAVMGQILSKDATGITVGMQGSGSRIVLVGSSTQVMKSSSGTQSDLVVGENVLVTGTQNQDGSITAQSVQIRPAGMTMPMMGGAPRGGGQ